MAMPLIGFRPNRGITGAIAIALKIDATLNIAGESEGMKKRRRELSIPIIAAAIASVLRKGSMIRVNRVVRASLPGTAANSASTNALVICGANRMPMTTSTPVTIRSAFITRLPSRQAASLPFSVSVRVNVGTNAAVIAPSANRSRSRFGTRNATLKASICGLALAPNTAASTVSRTRPSTRLVIVAAPISPADFASFELIA